MAIKFLDNQPIDFRGHLPSYSSCKANNCDSYCALYDINDTIRFQFKNEVTGGTELLCNPTLENNNTEMVSNGTFPTGTVSWTLNNFTYDSINQNVKCTSSVSGYIQQTMTLTVGSWYDVQFDVYVPAGGYARIYLGALYSADITVSGTYSLRLQAGAGNYLRLAAYALNITFDNVSVKGSIIGASPSYCYQQSAAYDDWIIDYGQHSLVKKVSNNTSYLSTYITPSTSNGSVRFQFDVNNVVGGQLLFQVNGANYSNNTLATITSSGHFDFYIPYTGLGGGDIELRFNPSTSFGGRISNLSCIDTTLQTSINLVGDHTSYNLAGFVSQYNEFYTINVPLASLALSEGTYNLCIDEIPTGTMHKAMIGDYNFSTCDWNGDANCSLGILDVSGTFGRYQYTFTTTSWDVDMYASSTMAFDFDILTRDWITNGSPSNLYLIDQSTNQIVATLITDVQGNTHYTGSVVINVNLGTWEPAFRLDFDSDPGDGDRHQFESIQLWQTAQSATTYCSNCIDIKSNHRCSVWISGKCDTSALDFDFHNNFEIGGRVRAMLINPKYKGSNQRYLDHNGKSIITSTATGKVYTLLIDYAPEKTHDWLRMALACDIIKIGDTYATSKQFVSLDGDYTPEWIDNIGNFPLSQCRVEVQALIDEKYNNNPG